MASGQDRQVEFAIARSHATFRLQDDSDSDSEPTDWNEDITILSGITVVALEETEKLQK
jgi:hypothetical protein